MHKKTTTVIVDKNVKYSLNFIRQTYKLRTYSEAVELLLLKVYNKDTVRNKNV